jgi:hypothetical protein
MPGMGWFSRLLGHGDEDRDTSTGAGSSKPHTDLRPADEPASGPVAGPSWMSDEDWTKQLSAYTQQGRSDAAIRDVVAHLERRGPAFTSEQKVSYAQQHGYVAREEFMSPDVEAEALKPGPGGVPDARLVRERDRLVVATPRGWVNPRSRTAYKAGLHTVITRGTGYHQAAVKAGRFTPGAPIRLVREPDNEHDPNAIAIYAERARRKAGYVPRGTAKRLAKLIDGGADLVAVSLRGAGPGSEGVNPQILICERTLFEHLTRDWPSS